MQTRESRLQNGIFVYKRGISFTKQESHLQNGILGVQTGLSGCYLPLQDSKYICAYTDGCMQYFENKEVSQKTIQNPDSIKDSGSERTLVIYSRD